MLAYLDPFTGSLVLQILAAGFVGIIAFFRPIWYFFAGQKKKQNDELDDWDESSQSKENEKTEEQTSSDLSDDESAGVNK